ncbi:DoxX family protein [Psychromicrobium sp. YIM B11713]|uniref:DoxX family protein n=1 Tax=Psychromicrobium sp. YIM B11713 TaxID=3145233 RepID=UPI00374EA968
MAKTSNTAHLGLILLRVVTGLIFIMHGWQKFNGGITSTVDGFRSLGVLAPEFMGPFIAGLELFGGSALIIGLLTRPISVLLLANMIGAGFLVHLPNGFFAATGGYEYVLALAAMAGTLALTGAGKFSVDGLLFGRSKRLKTVLA